MWLSLSGISAVPLLTTYNQCHHILKKSFLLDMNIMSQKKQKLLPLKCYFHKNVTSVSLYSPYILWLFPGTDTTGMEDTGRRVWDETFRSARRTGARTAPAAPTASCLKTKLYTLTDARRPERLLPRTACNHHHHHQPRRCHHQRWRQEPLTRAPFTTVGNFSISISNHEEIKNHF